MQKLEQTVEDISLKYDDGVTPTIGDFIKPNSGPVGKYKVSSMGWLRYIVPGIVIFFFAGVFFGEGYAKFSIPFFYVAVFVLPIVFFVSFFKAAKDIINRYKRYGLFAEAIGYRSQDFVTLPRSGSFHETDVLNAVYSGASLDDSEVVFGNLMLKNGDGKEIAQQGFIRVKLNKQLPHVLFDTNSHKAGANAHAYAKSQIFEPEGDFNTYFSVYCPKDYERDLLYLFTPEKLQILMQLGAQYDTELYKEYLYVYTKGPLEYGKTEMEALTLYASALTKALEKPAARYVDAKSTVPGEVAETGKRLKNRPVGLLLLLLFLICVVGTILLDKSVIAHLPHNAAFWITGSFAVGYILITWQLGKRS